MPNELEMDVHVPFDFFGLGQLVSQQEQNGQEEEDQQQENQDQEQQQGLNDQNQLQQINPWELWAEWPDELLAQQQAQQLDLNFQQPTQQLNMNALPQQAAQMEIDLNLDPLEVIINPVNPPPNDFLELNDFIEEIEQVIPQKNDANQQQNPDPEVQNQNLMQVDDENIPFLNGFPIPQLPNLIGEEVPLDQLVDQAVE